jgi:hypothetical protein
MRTVFLTTLCATAIGFLTLTAALSQSMPAAPAANTANVSHFSKTSFSAMARMRKPQIKRGVLIDGMKRDPSWYKEMRDPCQVEG